MVIGGTATVDAFIKAGLVNELILVVEPVLFGKGLSLLNEDLDCRLVLLHVKGSTRTEYSYATPFQPRNCSHSTATIADATAVLSSFGWEGNASRRVNSRRSNNMLSAS